MVVAGSEDDGEATLGSVAEAETLRRIFPRLPPADTALIGPGDDAAVLVAPDGRYVVTTDMMIHGPDFRFAWSSPHELGWKAAATNLSDIAAMGARPTALVVALAAPIATKVAVFEEFADGLREACAALARGCGVVGGDLSVSDTFTIAVTAFGDLEGRAPVLRSGARPGEIVALSGALGQAGEGLRLLFAEGVDEAGVPSAERAADVRTRHAEAIAAQLTPRPPISDGVLAAVSGATAMMDVSDGLALDSRRLADASGVAIDLHSSALGADVHAALQGGEDHSLIATFPAAVELPGGFRRIGRVVAGSGVLIDGEPYRKPGGWDPYVGWDGGAG